MVEGAAERSEDRRCNRVEGSHGGENHTKGRDGLLKMPNKKTRPFRRLVKERRRECSYTMFSYKQIKAEGP